MIDICEIFVHWHAGRSKNEVAGSLGLSRNTVRKYVAAAESAGMVPGGPAVSQEEWARLAREWFPELADTRLRQVTWPAIGEHRDYIVAQLEAGVTVATIHQRLRDERGLAVSVASLRRYVAANLPEEARRSQVRVLSLHPAVAGERPASPRCAAKTPAVAGTRSGSGPTARQPSPDLVTTKDDLAATYEIGAHPAAPANLACAHGRAA